MNAELISNTDRLKAIAVLENQWLHGQWMKDEEGFVPTFWTFEGTIWTQHDSTTNIVLAKGTALNSDKETYRLNARLPEFVNAYLPELICPENRRQQLFDRIAMHLMQQAAKCADSSGVCVYSDVRPNKRVLKCAVGCLFPAGLADTHGFNSQGVPTYQRIMNTDPMKSGHRIMQGFREAFDQAGVDWRDPGAIELLARLQTVHDGARSADHPQDTRTKWLPELQGVAEKMGLNDLTLRRLAVKYCCELL